MTITWSLSTVVGTIKIDHDKKIQVNCWQCWSPCGYGGTMWGVSPITQWSASWVSLKATGCHHRASDWCGNAPASAPWSTIFGVKHKTQNTLRKTNFSYLPYNSFVCEKITFRHKKDHTHVIDTARFGTMRHSTIEDLSYISSHQMLRENKKSWTYQSATGSRIKLAPMRHLRLNC